MKRKSKFVLGGFSNFAAGLAFAFLAFRAQALTAEGRAGGEVLPVARTANGWSLKLGNPTTGEFKQISGSPLANSGSQDFLPQDKNAAGEPDWVLLFNSAP